MVIKAHLLELLGDEIIDIDADITIINFRFVEKIGVKKGLTFNKNCQNKAKQLPIFPPNKAMINFEKPSYIKLASGETLYSLESPALLNEQLV